MYLWQDLAVEAVEMYYKWDSSGKSMHCTVEGEASSLHIPNPGSRTADTLSFPGFALGGIAQGTTKALLKRADKCFLSSGRDRHAIVWELRCRIPPDPWKENSDSRCISAIPGNTAANLTPSCLWIPFGPECSIRGAVTATHSQSCSRLQGHKSLRSLWRSVFWEQLEGAQLWCFCASHLALQTAVWEAKGVCYIIIAHPVIPSFLVLAKKH